MLGPALLAWRYVTYHRGRTALLVAALSLTLFLPLATHWIIQRFEKQATERAAATPLVFGTKGSRFALAMHALYFRGESPSTVKQEQVRRIEETKLAKAIPLFARFKTQGYTIVGTTNEYRKLRGLDLDRGEPLQRIGDCLLGASVAKKLGLVPGDRLLSEPENLFDLSGPSPLRMRITGVLKATGTADDEIVLCDLKTTWIIQGIGHAHSIKRSPAAEQDRLPADDSKEHSHQASRGNLQEAAEVTDANIDTFHFHGRSDQYPLTAIIAIPDSEKSETLLLGRYLGTDETHQIIRPTEVVDELMIVVGQVRRLIDSGAILLAIATLLLVTLVLLLSLRLREREMQTMVMLGCSRGTMLKLLGCELAIVLSISLCLAIFLAKTITRFSDWLVTHTFL